MAAADRTPALLELHAAAGAAGRALGCRRIAERERLLAAVRRVLVLIGAGHVVFEHPGRDVAFEQFRHALQVARQAGVNWADVVAAVNGEEGF